MSLYLRFFLCCLLCLPVSAFAQTANFTGAPVAGCAPLVVQFTNTSSGNITSYDWDFGNGAPHSAFQNPSTTYLTPGTYTVTLTVTGPGGANAKTSTAYITVYNQPTVTFATPDTAGCPPYVVHFTSTSVPNAPGGMTYSWDFGDGSGSPQQSPVHTYYTPGFYSPSLVVTNSYGCSKTLVQAALIDVFTPPTGNFVPSTAVYCHPPASVSFINGPAGVAPFTTAWAFGDGSTGNGNTITHNYTAAGTYAVTAITTDGHGCRDTIPHPAGVIIYPGGSFSGTTAICIYDTAHFTNTSANANSTHWAFGDGGTDTAHNTQHAYNTAGTFTVTMITDLGGCLDTITHAILVNPTPIFSLSTNPTYPCDTPALVQFSGTATGAAISSWSWDFGDTTTLGTGSNPSHTYHHYGQGAGLSGRIKYIVNVVSAAGCPGKDSSYLYLTDHKLFLSDSVTDPGGCAPFTFHFTPRNTSIRTPTLLYPFATTSYSWTYGDGTPGTTAASPTHTYTNPGTYTTILTITTANGCTFTDSAHVHVGTPPVASFYCYPLTACVKKDIHFVSTSTSIIPAATYQWDFGDNTSQYNTGASTTHIYQAPGVFTVTLHVFNNGCEDTAKITAYVTINPPNATFHDSLICPVGQHLIGFTNLSIGATSQSWTFGDGTGSTSANPPAHGYPGYGTYTTQLITYNSTYGCTDTFTQVLTLPQPNFNFTALDTTVCFGDSLKLVGTNASGSSFYEWGVDGQFPTFGPDTFSHFTWPVVLPRGYHSVSLITMDVNGCLDTLTKTNYVLVSRPIPGFSATPLLGCTPLNVIFTDTSHYTVGTVPLSRAWTYGDGGTGTNNLATISHVYTAAGVYDVTLIATDNNGCADSLLKFNYIDARHPHAAFTPMTATPCIGQAVTFSNNSTGAGTLTSDWTFGDGGTSASSNPTHTYGATGTYSVRLIITDNTGCKDTANYINLISVAKPHAAFTMSDSLAICPPLLVHFTNNSANATAYQWDFGNSSPSSLTNPVNTFTAPGTYTVRLIAFNAAGCTDTAFATVRVLGYAGALTYTPLTGCAPLTVNFTAAITNVPNLVWDFSDGVTMAANGATISHTYTTRGAFVPKLIFSNGAGCVASSVGLDTIKVDGVIAGFKALPPCVNTPVTFTDTSKTFFSALTGWSWNFGNGNTNTGHTTTHIYTATGTYPVTLIATNAAGCRDTVTEQITIYDRPLINATGDTTVCPSDPALLFATGGLSYTWSPAATLSCAACAATVAHTPGPVTYVVTGTDARGCKNTDSARVNIQYKTTSTVGADGAICLGQSIQLTAGGAQVYAWSPAEVLDNANTATPLATPTATTIFRVIATEGSCPADTNYVKVTVHPLPDVHISGTAMVIAGGSTSLTASGSNTAHYLWLADPGLSCTACASPTATPRATTTYTVVAFSDFGCTDTASATVHILCDASQVFIPNTFTPNNDGQNDYFYPRGAGIDHIVSFRVYSRWGELLYERTGIQLNDESTGWDGKYKGTLLSPDVYVYVLEAVCENGEPVKWKGDVTLMR